MSTEPPDIEQPELNSAPLSILEACPDAAWVANMNGYLTWANDAACSMLELDREQLIGMHLFDFERGSVAIFHDVLAAVRSGESWRGVAPFRRGSGKRGSCELTAYVVSADGAGSEPSAIVGIQRELGETMRAQDELQLATMALDHIDAAVYVVRQSDLHVVHTNARFDRLFGTAPGEYLGKHVDVLSAHIASPKDDSEGPRLSGIVPRLNEKGFWSGEVKNRHKNNSEFWCRVTITASTHHEHGAVWISLNEDITRLKRAEEDYARLESRLVRSRRLQSIGTLAGGVAHDFNNILQGVYTLADLVMDTSEDADITAWNSDIKGLARRGQKLVEQILTFSGLGEQAREPMCIATAVREAVDSASRSAPDFIRIKSSIGASSVSVVGNALQLQQVLFNLLGNAVDSITSHGSQNGTEERGVISVSLDTAINDGRKGVTISVRDNGPGMSSEVQDQVFDPFFTTKGGGGGTGMGLAMVHSIIEAHRGTISVRSAPGHGATFSVFLPSDGSVVETASSESKPVRVLYVEDEAIVAKAMSSALRRKGYAVEVCGCAEDALELFAAQGICCDVLLTDQKLPGMTGMSLGKTLQEGIAPELPMIIITGYENFTREALSRAGFRASLQKPCTMRVIVDTLDSVLADERTPASG